MTTKKTTAPKEISAKEKIVQDITATLAGALVSLKESLGEKKFDKRIKKAAKILGEGIKPAPAKKVADKKTTAKINDIDKDPVKKTPVKKVAKAPTKK